jgi:hypothetical protein
MFKKIFLTTLLLILLPVGVVKAETVELPDPGMLPTSNFYFLKTITENIGLFFTFNEEAKAERLLELSERRLAEIEALTELGEVEKADKIMSRYEKHIERAFERAEKMREKGVENEELLMKISNATFKHQNVLVDVYERVPEQAKPAIEKAMEQGMKGYERALENVSTEQNRERMMMDLGEQMQEMERVRENFEDRGIKAPKMPSREQIKESLPENFEMPDIDLPAEIPADMMQRRGR